MILGDGARRGQKENFAYLHDLESAPAHIDYTCSGAKMDKLPGRRCAFASRGFWRR
jgi:hypothetical protein